MVVRKGLRGRAHLCQAVASKSSSKSFSSSSSSSSASSSSSFCEEFGSPSRTAAFYLRGCRCLCQREDGYRGRVPDTICGLSSRLCMYLCKISPLHLSQHQHTVTPSGRYLTPSCSVSIEMVDLHGTALLDLDPAARLYKPNESQTNLLCTLSGGIHNFTRDLNDQFEQPNASFSC